MSPLLAQASAETTSSAGTVVVVVFLLIAVFSIVALFTRGGRRLLLPVTALTLGLTIGATTIVEASWYRISPITLLGLGIAALMVFGGLGALREGIVLPRVEGHDPEVPPAPPRITPDDL